jgi:hypothetical protein
MMHCYLATPRARRWIKVNTSKPNRIVMLIVLLMDLWGSQSKKPCRGDCLLFITALVLLFLLATGAL